MITKEKQHDIIALGCELQETAKPAIEKFVEKYGDNEFLEFNIIVGYKLALIPTSE